MAGTPRCSSRRPVRRAPLLLLHDVLVLGEDAFGEPGDERPRRVDEAGTFGFFTER